MNRENEEQRPISQTICGALQKEPNCKCLVLSVLIYGCLAAVTWCRCANVTKVVINFSRYPIKSTKHVSPCDDGYIYIPVAFMGMLYLVYLVECYHSPIRLDLVHAESQDSVLSKLSQLRSAQPTIWWKAVSYHYVRRKRQITRYRNGDNYTTTQVYYERINTHVATSFYYYDYCGVKDISKELVLDPKIRITKIMLTKGFAFSNVRSATEFEEARSRFFAEQELRDDYMEMREGLDLGYNPNSSTLIAVLGNPWFTNRYVYWCLSALLLSWPLRVIIEYKTQYADYQVTKLFGVHYDTPTGSEPIHTSMSQLSHPGSYMLAPSYSEALLMDPVPSDQRHFAQEDAQIPEMVPSYSEALLYARAEQSNTSVNDGGLVSVDQEILTEQNNTSVAKCSYSSQGIASNEEEVDVHIEENNSPDYQATLNYQVDPGSNNSSESHSPDIQIDVENREENVFISENRKPDTEELGIAGLGRVKGVLSNPAEVVINLTRKNTIGIPRDMSEPNLGARSKSIQTAVRSLKLNGKSLQNILENVQEIEFSNNDRMSKHMMETKRIRGRLQRSGLSLDESIELIDSSKGAIPKRTVSRSRIITNPMSKNSYYRLPSSKSHFSLKSILKQNKRPRLANASQELETFFDPEEFHVNQDEYCEGATISSASRFSLCSRSRESLDETFVHRKKKPENALVEKRDCRTLIFASPIQEVCPTDPFGGKNVVRTKRETVTSPPERVLNQTSLFQRHSPTMNDPKQRKSFSYSIEHQYPYQQTFASNDSVNICESARYQSGKRRYRSGLSFPPYRGATSPQHSNDTVVQWHAPPKELATSRVINPRTELTRSLTERRTKSSRKNIALRRSFTGRIDDYRMESGKCKNLSIETSL